MAVHHHQHPLTPPELGALMRARLVYLAVGARAGEPPSLHVTVLTGADATEPRLITEGFHTLKTTAYLITPPNRKENER